MTTCAIGMLAVLGELFANRHVPRVCIVLERRNVVGRWWRWIIQDDLDDPCPSGNRMGPLGTRGHAQHGRIGDDSTVARVIGGSPMENLGTQLAPHIVVKTLLGLPLELVGVERLGCLVQGIPPIADFFLQLILGLSLFTRESGDQILVGNEELVTAGSFLDFLSTESPIVEHGLVDAHDEVLVPTLGKVS